MKHLAAVIFAASIGLVLVLAHPIERPTCTAGSIASVLTNCKAPRK